MTDHTGPDPEFISALENFADLRFGHLRDGSHPSLVFGYAAHDRTAPAPAWSKRITFPVGSIEIKNTGFEEVCLVHVDSNGQATFLTRMKPDGSDVPVTTDLSSAPHTPTQAMIAWQAGYTFGEPPLDVRTAAAGHAISEIANRRHEYPTLDAAIDALGTVPSTLDWTSFLNDHAVEFPGEKPDTNTQANLYAAGASPERNASIAYVKGQLTTNEAAHVLRTVCQRNNVPSHNQQLDEVTVGYRRPEPGVAHLLSPDADQNDWPDSLFGVPFTRDQYAVIMPSVSAEVEAAARHIGSVEQDLDERIAASAPFPAPPPWQPSILHDMRVITDSTLYNGVPFFASADAVDAVGGAHLDDSDYQYIRLPYPSVLVYFDRPLRFDDVAVENIDPLEGHATPEAFMGNLTGTCGGWGTVLGGLSRYGGGLVGVRLIANPDGTVSDTVQWLLSVSPDPRFTASPLSPLFMAVWAHLPHAHLRYIAWNLAAYTSWGDTTTPRRLLDIPPSTSGGSVRKLLRTSAARKAIPAGGAIPGLRIIQISPAEPSVSAPSTSRGRGPITPHLRRGHWRRVRLATRNDEGAIIGDIHGTQGADWHYELRFMPPTLVGSGALPADARVYQLPTRPPSGD